MVCTTLTGKAKPKSKPSLIRANSAFKQSSTRPQMRASTRICGDPTERERRWSWLSAAHLFCYACGHSRVASSKTGKRGVSESKKSAHFRLSTDQLISHLARQYSGHRAERQEPLSKMRGERLSALAPLRDALHTHFVSWSGVHRLHARRRELARALEGGRAEAS